MEKRRTHEELQFLFKTLFDILNNDETQRKEFFDSVQWMCGVISYESIYVYVQ
jgi:hypothetical protein